MARRSARLQKRSPTPERSSTSSWETAHGGDSEINERLPSVVEGAEHVEAVKTPQKPAGHKLIGSTSISQVRTPQNRTPIKPSGEEMHPAHHHASTKKIPVKPPAPPAIIVQSAIPQASTPKNRTPIKPAGKEMHPEYYHGSTAKILDEARWLGFQALGAHTAPSKAADPTAIGTTTPSKTPVPASSSNQNVASSPAFKFSFKSPLAALSPSTRRLVKDGDKPNATPGQKLFAANEFSAPADVSPRKIAVPKTRYSDVHAKQFKKMDSIANHASAFRADPNRFKPVFASLKRSPSKAELDKQESTSKTPNKLKRTQSKMDVTEPNANAPAPTPKLVATSLKRTQSKIDVTESNSKLPRSHSTVRLVPPSRDGRPQPQHGDSPAKRHKRTETDDAASTRPVFAELPIEPAKPNTPARPVQPKSGLPRLHSRLFTPTKSSIARSQSVKTLKTTSMLPALVRSPSTRTLFSPTNMAETMKEGVREGIRKTSNSLNRVRSILRTPSRKFSDNPAHIAAGTHMSPPPGLDLEKALPDVPQTAPVRKHVNFTSSTLERAAIDELGKSPSPMKLRAGSEVPSGSVIYPKLGTNVEYPSLPEGVESESASPSRRLTFGGATENTPATFSFKSDRSINFGPASSGSGTIRVVRKSDASSLVGGTKRKLETTVEESSDKENSAPLPPDKGRSAKKARMSVAEVPKTPSKTPSKSSMLPRRTPKSARASGISKSRLAFLATPKRG